MIAGLGRLSVRKVPTNEALGMDAKALKLMIQKDKDAGLKPFFVGATIGTTACGSSDDLQTVGSIAKHEPLWLHVDAAWGGTCLFSNEHRRLMDGVEKADSVCWDAHKMMGVPLICSAFLVKEPDVLRRLCDHTNVAHYLFHADAELDDLGRYSLQCARRNDALKLWIDWRARGDAGWARMVDERMADAAHLQRNVEAHPSLEMMSSRMWTNVCFRYTISDDEVDLNTLNTEIRNRLIQEGSFMVSRSNIGDDVVLRMIVANQNLDRGTLDRFLDRVVHHGQEILRGLPAA